MRSSREAEPRWEPDAAAAPAASAPDHAPAAPHAAQQRIEELEGQLAALEDRFKRALADLDNLRKRSARDIERRVGEQREAMLRDWLEALDSVERALRQPVAPDNPLFAGLQAVLEQMEAILHRQGVQRIASAGERFDPERHQAVGVHQTDQVPDHCVVEIARSGFALGERVLRPAEVIVARDPEAGR
ncbi:MAG TPA: nucleotide exchange factor GrpE [Solirubrobacteraceae bacterium]|nr:nucleotide exchange factor GrpE [Solirubrobacteraceae bacterium]